VNDKGGVSDMHFEGGVWVPGLVILAHFLGDLCAEVESIAAVQRFGWNTDKLAGTGERTFGVGFCHLKNRLCQEPAC
jgi:hypothetical protein